MHVSGCLLNERSCLWRRIHAATLKRERLDCLACIQKVCEGRERGSSFLSFVLLVCLSVCARLFLFFLFLVSRRMRMTRSIN